MRKRILELDIAKGVAIFLVVFGHLVSRDYPEGNQWYKVSKLVVYNFHMPFFMFLSGFTFYYSFKPIDNYLKYLYKMFKKLIIPIFIFGLIVFLGKSGSSFFLEVDNKVNSVSVLEYFKIFYNPFESYAVFFWYILVLFYYFAIMPLILKVLKYNLKVVLLISILIHFIPLPTYFGLNFFSTYLLFFTIGMIVSNNYELALPILKKYGFFFIVIFIAAIFYVVNKKLYINVYGINKTILGLLSLPAIYYLATILKQNIFYLFGRYTFSIYLMNTICIGVIKGILLKFVDWNGPNFIWVAVLILLGGLFVPIAIKKYVLRHIKFLDKMIV